MNGLCNKHSVLICFTILILLLFSSGCSKRIRVALPEHYIDRANVVDMGKVRDWGDAISDYYQNDILKSAKLMLIFSHFRGEAPKVHME